MRGDDILGGTMWSSIQPEDRVPADHPLREIREIVNAVLKALSPQFATLYSVNGRPSIPPERLLRALLLQIFFTIRSERQLMEQLQYNILFRWFVGMNMDDAVWDVTVFTKNRDRLLEGDIARAFFTQVLGVARKSDLLSTEHFSVDGTLIEAWASQKSVHPKDDPPSTIGGDGVEAKNPSVDFHGEKRTNETHASITDPDARFARKSKGSGTILAYSGHVVMENRNGLVVDAMAGHASGTAECDASIAMLAGLDGNHPITVGADKKYDTGDWTGSVRELGATPHVAQNTKRRGGSSIDGRTTRHVGYGLSQRARKRIEEVFGWMKTVGTVRKTKLRGVALVNWMFTLNAAAYNLVRMANLRRATT